MKKCDEVTSITNDMFIHSLHDLDRLVVKSDEVEINLCWNRSCQI